jgi:hypothetical protein
VPGGGILEHLLLSLRQVPLVALHSPVVVSQLAVGEPEKPWLHSAVQKYWSPIVLQLLTLQPAGGTKLHRGRVQRGRVHQHRTYLPCWNMCGQSFEECSTRQCAAVFCINAMCTV